MHRSATGPISPISVAPSAKSWVTFNPPNPAPLPPPPAPVPLTITPPADNLRHLPNPYARRQAFRVVNTMEPPRRARDHQDEIRTPDANLAAYNQARRQFTPEIRPLKPAKKQTLLGGFVKGIRQFPRNAFGLGSAPPTPEPSVQRVRVNLDADSPPGSRYTSPDSTPGQLHNLPSISARPLPKPYQPKLQPQYSPPHNQERDSPLPEVVRVGDHRDNRPTFRVTSPSPDLVNEERAEIYDAPLQPPDFDHPPIRGPTPSTLERTTVMVYHDETPSRAPSMAPALSNDPRLEPLGLPPAPEPSHSVPFAGPRVSYAPQQPPTRASRPLPVPRPPSRALPPSIPSTIPESPDPQSPEPFLPLVEPEHVPMPIPTPTPAPPPVHLRHPPPIMIPPTIVSVPDVEPPPVEESEPASSPVDARPEPTNDYRKMGASTAAPSETTRTRTRRTRSTWTSYFTPSAITEYHPIERFCKLLYQLPWVAQERVTVDYMPGEARQEGKGKKKYNKPMRSWYTAVLSASRRNSASIDLLSNGTPSQRSGGESQGSGSGQPSLTTPMSHESGSGHRRRHDSHREYRHDRHHRSHHRDGHHRRRTASDTGHRHRHRAHGTPPLPAVYPFPYSPYPIAFPIPAPLPPPPSSDPSGNAEHGNKPTAVGPDKQPIPTALQPGAGYHPHPYSPFPPFMPPPVYMMPPHAMPPPPPPRTKKTPAGPSQPLSGTSKPPAQTETKPAEPVEQPTVQNSTANASIPGAFEHTTTESN